MNGEIQTATIVGVIHTANIVGIMHAANIAGILSCNGIIAGITVEDSMLPYYDEEYVVTPSVEEQTLATGGKSMHDNLVVESIPYYTTTNPSGGYTAIIGG